MPESDIRKIIHVDMDAFYASVEQRDFPEYRGKPVIVGGSPEKRGVVCAASYEVRPYGVRSAMSSFRAVQLCPHAIFVRPRFEAYEEVSQQIRDIFREYTDLVEPLSLDEAYLDVTTNKLDSPSATRIATEIRAKIKATTGLTASAGVSYNKLLAKIASDMNKPDGLKVIRPEDALDVLAALPIDMFYGVGKVTAEDMRRKGIHTGADLLAWPEESLIQTFGKYGWVLYRMARGEDDREVSPVRQRKSVGSEHTFSQDLTEPAIMADALEPLLDDALGWLVPRNLAARTLTVKIKFHDFRQITRSYSFPAATSDRDVLSAAARRLLSLGLEGPCRVRLLGVQLQNLGDPPAAPETEQLRLALPAMASRM